MTHRIQCPVSAYLITLPRGTGGCDPSRHLLLNGQVDMTAALCTVAVRLSRQHRLALPSPDPVPGYAADCLRLPSGLPCRLTHAL